MPDDVPPDVQAVLTQLFTEGQTAISAGDTQTARDIVTTVETVVTNKLPESALRARLRHGCERSLVALDATAEAEPAVAAGYFRAMKRRLERATG